MGFLDRMKQAARDLVGDGDDPRRASDRTGHGQQAMRSYAQTPPPQTTAFGTIDADGRPTSRSYTTATTPPAPGADTGGRGEDEIAIERYRYLLRTAPPETIEQVHAEAFSRLTDAQRQQVLSDLSSTLPPQERPASADPGDMARAATRAEYLSPGTMERTFGPGRRGPGLGSMIGGSLLGTIAGYVVGSALVSAFMAPAFAGDGGAGDGGSEASGTPADDAGTEAAGDLGLGDVGGDFGGFDF
ncbi:hypothetical protein N8K70_10235 [Microbacterium betulae]|uniref:Uncharacterized protein n=1 Tax=Microbacterium betulae TaxID=2981139 RepID=A0AA97I5Q7_9MICO|nr:hypothetical protein [Microbacterium sp. AB]WOF21765.1 hypothetical protein N8K70_10235 [Microbacterium sp. AB]